VKKPIRAGAIKIQAQYDSRKRSAWKKDERRGGTPEPCGDEGALVCALTDILGDVGEVKSDR